MSVLRASKEIEYLLLVPTYRCNLRCRYCFVSKNVGEAPLGALIDIVQQAEELGVHSIVIDGGEPTLYSGIKDLLRFLGNVKASVTLLTNGTLIHRIVDDIPSNVLVQLSLDGRKEVTDYLRGSGVFDRVIEATRLLRDRGIRFGFSMVFNNYTRNEVFYLLELAHRLGAEFIHINYQVGNYGDVRQVPLEEYWRIHNSALIIGQMMGIKVTTPYNATSYCRAGVSLIALTPELNYTICSRQPNFIIGYYPEPLKEVAKRLMKGYVTIPPCISMNPGVFIFKRVSTTPTT